MAHSLPARESGTIYSGVELVNRRAKDRWIDGAALAALAALTLLFFWKIALTNRVLVGLDVFSYFYPYRDFASEALRSGHLPLWNPYLFMGAPLLANSQVAVLYPLHWPLIWLSAPKQVAWSITLHVWLAAAGTYLVARRALGLSPLASLTSAIIFALGGFLGAQVEHVNQLNASAWLPWLLLSVEVATGQARHRWLALLGGAAVASLILLAGHTQAAYIVFFGAGVYTLCRGMKGWKDPDWKQGLKGVGLLALMIGGGLILAAGQLWPTLELSSLSVRSGGLPYNEAASFSLKPQLLFKAFLPPLVWDPPFTEYVAYVGLVGLVLAAAGAWATLKQGCPGRASLVLALAGVFLAFGAYNPVYYLLYRVVPGFDLFRAPARWLLLYSFGAAILTGIGLEAFSSLKRWRWGIVLLCAAELLLASQRLAYNSPTAPAAYDSMRTAPAHLLADMVHASDGELFRFLSLSDILYDPGDLSDLQAMYSPQLSDHAIYDLVVATKMKEVLAFNLPLLYRIFSVDGYDGGLLPIANYVTLERLFLAADEIWPDGRLRQQLQHVPPPRLLSLLNVKYVITDKVQDVWIDDVFYDLEHTLPLGEVSLTDLPDFTTTDLGIVSYLTGTHDVVDDTPVAQVIITPTAGAPVVLTLLAGEHTAEGQYEADAVAHRQARVGHHWLDDEQGSDYITVLDLGAALQPVAISVRSLLPGMSFHLRGLTLIDNFTGTSRNLSIHPAYRLVHSGDVKIYRNLAVLPRAFIVHRARVIPDDEMALQVLNDPTFDVAAEVILSEGIAQEGGMQKSSVDINTYTSEEIQLRAELDAPGYLVLTDTYYPGWEALVDGQPASILRADLYFRAVPLATGSHRVTFRFRPSAVHSGLGLGLIAWSAWLLLAIVAIIYIGRKLPSSV